MSTSTFPVVGTDRDTGLALLAKEIGQSATLSFVVSDYNYDYFSGTSMATPHVAGVAALIWSKHPTCGPTDIRTAMNATAVDLGATGSRQVLRQWPGAGAGRRRVPDGSRLHRELIPMRNAPGSNPRGVFHWTSQLHSAHRLRHVAPARPHGPQPRSGRNAASDSRKCPDPGTGATTRPAGQNTGLPRDIA